MQKVWANFDIDVAELAKVEGDGDRARVIVLGIDPGTASTGYGVVKGDGLGLVSLVECGVIRTRARDPLAARLRRDLRRRRRAARASPADRALGRRRLLREERSHDRRARARARRRAARRTAGGRRHPRASAGRDQEGRRRHRRGDEGASAVHADATAATQVGAAAVGRGGRRRGRARLPHERASCRRSPARISLRSARMIAQVSGTLVTQELDRVEIMTAGGVAYELAIPLGVYETLPRPGEPLVLHTHLVVKEDAWQLFGFSTHVRAARLSARAERQGRRPGARARPVVDAHRRSADSRDSRQGHRDAAERAARRTQEGRATDSRPRRQAR